MGIVTWPDNVERGKVTCLVCDEEIEIIEATVGPRDMHGHQAFVCNHHVTPGGSMSMIRAWIDFSIQQSSDNGLSNRGALALD